jgi:integrase/recombinase XerD
MDRIGDFLHFMSVERSVSSSTTSAYKTDLKQLRYYIFTNGTRTWQDVSKDTVEGFLVELRRRGYKESSICRKLTAAKSFFEYLEAEGNIQTNPTETIALPRTDGPIPKALSVCQISSLREQAGRRQTRQTLRDRAVLELVYATGIRCTELVSLDLDSISFESDPPLLHCIGPEGKERYIPINDQAVAALVKYLEVARPRFVRRKNQQALFLNKRGERMTRQGITLSLHEYAKTAGLDGEVTPLALRHSFAIHNLKDGVPIVRIQKWLGHADISSTQIYLKALAVQSEEGS